MMLRRGPAGTGNKRGDVFLMVIGIAIACVVVFTIFFYAIRRGLSNFIEGPNFDPRFQAVVDEWKVRAPIVVVGRIDSAREVVNERRDKQTANVLSYYVMDLSVEYVERGNVPEEDITLYFGWFSIETEDEEAVPAKMKQTFQAGDRIRIFLDVDQRFGYYTPWSYYTIEKLAAS